MTVQLFGENSFATGKDLGCEFKRLEKQQHSHIIPKVLKWSQKMRSWHARSSCKCIYIAKHCQGHNGPEDWVLLTKVTYSGHITWWPHISWSNFIWGISTKHQIQNLNPTSASRPNLKFKILSRILTKIQLHNLYKTSAKKYRPNSSFKFCLNSTLKSWPNLVLKVRTKIWFYEQSSAPKSATNCCQYNPHHQH